MSEIYGCFSDPLTNGILMCYNYSNEQGDDKMRRYRSSNPLHNSHYTGSNLGGGIIFFLLFITWPMWALILMVNIGSCLK